MLRPKQLGPICHSARSLFVSGSRSGTVDGTCASTICSEDETFVSRLQPKIAPQLFPQKPEAYTLIYSSTAAAAAKIGTCISTRDSQVLSAPLDNSSLGAEVETFPNNGDNGTHEADAPKNFAHYSLPSASASEHFVKAGIATMSFLSDLVNYKLPVSLNGNSVPVFMPHSYVVESDRSFVPNEFSRSSKIKKLPTKEATFTNQTHAKPSDGSAGGSNSTVDRHGHSEGTRANRSGYTKGSKHVPPTNTTRARGSSIECNRAVASDLQDKAWQPKPPPKGAKARSFVSVHANSKPGSSWVAPERKVVTDITKSTGSKVVQHQPLMAGSKSIIAAAVAPSMNASGRAVEHVYHSLRRQTQWGPVAEASLWNISCSLDAYQANQVLKLLQDHSVALGFFYWLKREVPRYKHDAHCYTTMVGILGRAKQFGTINKLLDEMVKDGCSPNVVTYNRLIHSYGRANYMAQAVDIFHQMQEAGIKPDRVTYCTLIDIHAKAGFLEVAMDMYRRMQEAGLSPDTFTYSVIINCLGKAGHLSAAYNLFCKMVAQGCVPNLVTYNIMIALHAKSRHYTEALKLYRDMQAAGFRPDRVTYNIVMEALGHCGHLDEAEAVFAEMKRENWVPDEPVYGLLVDLWGKAGNVDKACAWYMSMLDAGLHPNVPTCNSLLSAFLRSCRFADAYNLLQSMLRLGLRPSLQTYTLLLSGCTDTLSHQRAEGIAISWCELMSITGHPAHAFLVTMPAAGPDGQNVRDHTSNFLDLMHSEDRESKRGLVDAVVDFFHKSGLKEEAGLVWEVAAERNVYPDALMRKSSSPSYWLINLHIMSEGTAVIALSRTLAWFRKGMLASGEGPHRIDIVTGWGRRSRVTGSSLVRQSVQELLRLFGSPFFTVNGNAGCFVGCGEPLSKWLLHSHVERMHLL